MRHASTHDAITRLLYRLQADPDELWQEARTQVTLTRGILVMMTQRWTSPKRPYGAVPPAIVGQVPARRVRHQPGHGAVDRWRPACALDWRVYDQPHNQDSKNDHFSAVIKTAKARGFAQTCVAFDSWYGSRRQSQASRWLTQLKLNWS